MQRTIIETAADSHILITLERNVRMGGNSHQRRVERTRALNDQKPIEWYRMGRVILRKGVPSEIPVKFSASKASITLLPLGSEEMRAQAYSNSIAAAEGVSRAEAVVEGIEHQQAVQEAARAVAPPKKRRLVWVEAE